MEDKKKEARERMLAAKAEAEAVDADLRKTLEDQGFDQERIDNIINEANQKIAEMVSMPVGQPVQPHETPEETAAQPNQMYDEQNVASQTAPDVQSPEPLTQATQHDPVLPDDRSHGGGVEERVKKTASEHEPASTLVQPVQQTAPVTEPSPVSPVSEQAGKSDDDLAMKQLLGGLRHDYNQLMHHYGNLTEQFHGLESRVRSWVNDEVKSASSKADNFTDGDNYLFEEDLHETLGRLEAAYVQSRSKSTHIELESKIASIIFGDKDDIQYETYIARYAMKAVEAAAGSQEQAIYMQLLVNLFTNETAIAYCNGNPDFYVGLMRWHKEDFFKIDKAVDVFASVLHVPDDKQTEEDQMKTGHTTNDSDNLEKELNAVDNQELQTTFA